MILPPALFFLEIAFGIWGSLCFHINFRIICSSFVKKNVIGIFFLFCFLVYFWLCYVFVATRGLSLVVASRGHSSVVMSVGF